MDDIEKLADIFKSLSDPTRLKLVRMLSTSSSEITLNNCTPDTCTGKGGPLCVNALANNLGVTQSAVSQHLRVLRQVGIVRGERKGSFVHYTIDRNRLDSFKAELRNTLGELFSIE